MTVDYATANGTATSPADYTARSGTLTFAPGQTTQQVDVLVNGDLLDEASETYFLNLTDPTNATLADNQGVGTIIDDDTPPTLSVGDVTVAEGNSGSVNAIFTVTLSAPSGQTVSVGHATADGTATAGSDYTPPAATSSSPRGHHPDADRADDRRHARRGRRDVHGEPARTVGATIADGEGIGTITDDDAPPTISVDDVTVTEGNSGTINATFTVSLTARAAAA